MKNLQPLDGVQIAKMEFLQKGLQIATAGILTLGLYIADKALSKLEVMELRQIANEQADALRELRIHQLEATRKE